jgi:hypothetical protein
VPTSPVQAEIGRIETGTLLIYMIVDGQVIAFRARSSALRPMKDMLDRAGRLAARYPVEAPGSIQRIFLGWKMGKAQVDKPKMALGPMKGTVARLGEPIDDQPLLIAEGVENAATGMAASGLPAWATFGTAGLKGFNPPDTVKWVIALAENDEANAKALAVLAPALAGRGIRLDVVKPPPGLKDVNDLVNGTSGNTPEAGLAVVRALIEATQASASAAGARSPVSGDSDDDEADKFSLTEGGLYRRKGQEVAVARAALRGARIGARRSGRRLGQARALPESGRQGSRGDHQGCDAA